MNPNFADGVKSIAAAFWPTRVRLVDPVTGMFDSRHRRQAVAIGTIQSALMAVDIDWTRRKDADILIPLVPGTVSTDFNAKAEDETH